MRRRFIQIDGKLVEVTTDYMQDVSGVLIVPDLPGYESPVTGLWVEGRRQRREDLKRTGCRPYEGREQETKEAARFRQYEDQKMDKSLDRAVHEAYYRLSPSKREMLRR